MAAPRAKRTASPQLTIRLLGRFDVLRYGKPIPDEAWGRRKAKTLLKVLLTEPGRVFTHDQLIEALFEGKNPKWVSGKSGGSICIEPLVSEHKENSPALPY